MQIDSDLKPFGTDRELRVCFGGSFEGRPIGQVKEKSEPSVSLNTYVHNKELDEVLLVSGAFYGVQLYASFMGKLRSGQQYDNGVLGWRKKETYADNDTRRQTALDRWEEKRQQHERAVEWGRMGGRPREPSSIGQGANAAAEADTAAEAEADTVAAAARTAGGADPTAAAASSRPARTKAGVPPDRLTYKYRFSHSGKQLVETSRVPFATGGWGKAGTRGVLESNS